MTQQFAREDAVRATDVAALWALAFAASALVGIHGLAYWDAGDYVRLALEGKMSGLLLGRPLFLLVSRLILSAGVDPVSAEVVLRWFWTGVGAIAAPALALLASRLGLPRRASLATGIALALSPSFAHSAHQVLTDAASLAMAICALLAAASSRAMLAGILIAIAILTRESAAAHLVAIALLLNRRTPIAIAIASATILMAGTLFIYPPPAFDLWLGAMSVSIESHPITLWQIVAPFLWVLAAGPVPVVAGIVILVRRRDMWPMGRWPIVAVPAAIGTVLLLFYPDGSFSPRYMLATAPLAFFLPAAAWMAARPRLMAVAFAVPLVLLFALTQPARVLAARGATLIDRVAPLPQNSLVVPGHYCPQARLGATIHKRSDLTMMCPGWEWPVEPHTVLDAALAAGRPVAVDTAGDAWLVREVDYRDAIRAWAAKHQGRNEAGFLIVERK